MDKVKVVKRFNPHRLYLAEVMAQRKTCPHCHVWLEPSNSVVSIGYYVSGIFRSGVYACRECYIDQITSKFKKAAYDLRLRNGYTVRWLTGGEQITL